jgi:hypothetical protein
LGLGRYLIEEKERRSFKKEVSLSVGRKAEGGVIEFRR